MHHRAAQTLLAATQAGSEEIPDRSRSIDVQEDLIQFGGRRYIYAVSSETGNQFCYTACFEECLNLRKRVHATAVWRANVT